MKIYRLLLIICLIFFSNDIFSQENDDLLLICDSDLSVVSNSQADYNYTCYRWNKPRNWGSFAQIDTSKLSVMYEYTFAVEVNGKSCKKKRDNFILQIGSNVNRCYSAYSQKIDSTAFAFIMSVSQKLADMLHYDGTPAKLGRVLYSWIPEDVFPLYNDVYTFVDKNEWMGASRFLYDEYQYTEKIEPFKWNILNDKATILGYECNRAEANFRGRRWIAYFTFDIPYTFGPWKFSGLPGLILKVTDSEGLFEWNAVGMSRNGEPIMDVTANQPTEKRIYNWIPNKKVRKCSRKEMERMWKRFWNAPATIKILDFSEAIITDAEGKDYRVSLSDPIRDGYYPKLELDIK